MLAARRGANVYARFEHHARQLHPAQPSQYSSTLSSLFAPPATLTYSKGSELLLVAQHDVLVPGTSYQHKKFVSSQATRP